MERKEALLAVVDLGKKLGEVLSDRLSEADRMAAGTYERWAPKDVVAHVTEWLRRDLGNLENRDTPVPAVTSDDLDPINRKIFAENSDRGWPELMATFVATYDAARAFTEQLNGEEIEAERPSTDGSARAVWRMISFHSLTHLAGHFSVVYSRLDHAEWATEVEESAAGMLLDLDDTPVWVGTVNYNLACHYALAGNETRAIELLRTALINNPGLTEWSKKDSDLDTIRDDPGFAAVYGE